MRKLVFLVTLVAALAVASPAEAIIHGHPDGDRHPYVGMTFNDEFVCSGTLIAPKVFLTAGHCADFLRVPSQGQGWVTFQEDGTSFPEDHKVAAAYTAPGNGTDSSTTSGWWRSMACKVSVCSSSSTRFIGAASACASGSKVAWLCANCSA